MSDKPDPSDNAPKKANKMSLSSHPLLQLHELAKVDWDPISTKRPAEIPSPQCLLRVKRDMMTMYSDPPPGIFAVPDSKDMTIVHALITGSFDTPYEGGLFYFLISCPPDYPIRPPRVRFMTTGGGTVRFNPNLYKSGKICLSILGTWTGPTWSPAQSLSSVLISIQSILNEKPYHNEPSYETEKCPGDSVRYNDIIQHETLRVAVCGMIENDTSLSIPKPLVDIMERTFLEFYDYYVSTAKKKSYLNGQLMMDPFRDERGTFQYKNVLQRLEVLQVRLSAAHSSPGDKTSDCSEISDTELDEAATKTTPAPPTR